MKRGDAFGHALPDHLDGEAAHVVRAPRFARGRCVDIGAGAGRVSVELQTRQRGVVLLHRLARERGRIVATGIDRRRGRLPGQLRLRVRYRDEPVYAAVVEKR